MKNEQRPDCFLVMAVSLLLYAASVAVFFSFYLENNLSGSWMIGLILFMTLLNHLYYVKSKHFSVWIRFFIINIGLLSAFSFAQGGAFGTGLLWALLFPFFTFQFLGYHKAIKVNVGYLLVLFAITLYQALLRQTWNHPPVFMGIYFTVFVLLLTMLYLFDKDKQTLIETLNVTSEKYETLFKQYNHGVCVVNTSFTALEVNDTLQTWFGEDPSTIVASLHQKTKHANGCLIMDTFHEKTSQSYVGVLPTLKGIRHFVVNAKPLYVNDHEDTTVMLTFEDVTERHLTLLETNERAKKFESLSYHDSLTNIPNRRYFEKHSKRLYNQALRYKQPIALLLVDIDLFKAYNDTLGHSKGDEALIHVAKVLNQVTQSYQHSFVARYGGEEFACVFYNLRIHESKAIARKIQEQLYQLAISHPSSDVHPTLTVSIGVTSEQANMKRSFERLFEQADLALYQAKNLGRNRVITYAKARQSMEKTPTPS